LEFITISCISSLAFFCINSFSGTDFISTFSTKSSINLLILKISLSINSEYIFFHNLGSSLIAFLNSSLSFWLKSNLTLSFRIVPVICPIPAPQTISSILFAAFSTFQTF
jgi:hypothetical protein